MSEDNKATDNYCTNCGAIATRSINHICGIIYTCKKCEERVHSRTTYYDSDGILVDDVISITDL